jgi:murein DD-endopeptidase MepM/ murein hydrolase activator NlpD
LMTSERPVLTFDYYKVKPGDTLSVIAKRYDSDVRRIARENNLNKSNFIVAGKKLKIPRGLYPAELEQYELAMEEQAYPFEEKSIKVHQSNLALITKGVYNEWIEKSLQKLAKLVPARYDKPEETTDVIGSLDTYIYEIDSPVLAALPDSELGTPDQIDESGSAAASETPEPDQIDEDRSATNAELSDPEKVEETGSIAEPESADAKKDKESESVNRTEPVESVKIKEPGSVTTSETTRPDNHKTTDLLPTGTNPAVRR